MLKKMAKKVANTSPIDFCSTKHGQFHVAWKKKNEELPIDKYRRKHETSAGLLIDVSLLFAFMHMQCIKERIWR